MRHHRILDTIKHISPLVNRYRSLQPGATYILPPTQEKQLSNMMLTLKPSQA